MADGMSSDETPKASNDNAVGVVPIRQCPICDQPATFEARPFCSKRCAEVDLGRWMTGRYAIPVEDDEDEDGELGMAPPLDD